MRKLLSGFLWFTALLLGAGCAISPKEPALHDFGLSVPASTFSRQGNNPAITVDAPTWLWDNRIRYRLLYASPTRVSFYALDLWIASPPELFEQLLISTEKLHNLSLLVRLHEFEQQFYTPDQARVVLSFSVEAYSDSNKKVGTQEFYLERPSATADAAGGVSGFASLTRLAADKIQVWLAGLYDQR